MRKKPEPKTNADLWADVIDVSLQSAQQEFGKEFCYTAAEHEDYQCGFEIPPLSLRWLIESDSWPLSRFTQSGGPKGTMKSTFCFQLEAWVLEVGGLVKHIDTENKTSMSLMRAVIPPRFFDKSHPDHRRFQILPATSVEMWQAMASNMVKTVKEFSASVGNTTPPFPILIAVDSLLGSKSNEAIAHVEASGEGQGRGYSDAPILISNYLGAYPNLVIGWPIVLHTVSHEKPGVTTGGMTRAGGMAPGFYASLDIQFRLAAEAASGISSALTQSARIDRVDLKGKNIKLTLKKSSMGSDIGKEMVVPFLWRYELDAATGQQRQIAWWDWQSTTAMVLKKEAKTLAKIDVDIQFERKGQGRGEYFWSSTLGISKADAVPATDFGRAIENDNPELRAHIEAALHIQKHTVVGATPATVTPPGTENEVPATTGA